MRILFAVLLFLLALTISPAASTWSKYAANPVLVPSLTWERGAVFEPSVLYENGRFRMWYSGGNTNCSVGYAESMDGAHWTKHGQALIVGACRNAVTRVDDTLYMVYSRITESGLDGAQYLATSRDGLTWTVSSQPIMTPDERFIGLANSTLWRDGDTWYLTHEGMTPEGIWQIGETSSSTPFHFAPASAYASRYQIAAGGMYGGAWRLGDTLYYHASPNAGNLPTEGYRYRDGRAERILPLTLGFEVDQVADLSAVIVNEQTWVYYSGCDNRKPETVFCAIGLALEG